MVDALAMALLTLFAKRGATSLRALSNPDGQPPFMHAFRTAFQSAYCVQALRPWWHTEPWPPGAYGQGRKPDPHKAP